jgi:hypothetical protein
LYYIFFYGLVLDNKVLKVAFQVDQLVLAVSHDQVDVSHEVEGLQPVVLKDLIDDQYVLFMLSNSSLSKSLQMKKMLRAVDDKRKIVLQNTH